MRRYVIPAVAVLLALWLAWDVSARVHRSEPVIVRDTAGAAAYRTLEQEYEELRARADRQAGVIGNLRAEVEGLRRRSPGTVTVYDTLVAVDTVRVYLRVGAVDGEVTSVGAGPVIDTLGRRQPKRETHDVRGCSEWWLDDRGLICRRSPWGHLWARGMAGATRADRIEPWASVEFQWRPSLDSPWSVSVARDPERWLLFVARELRIF